MAEIDTGALLGRRIDGRYRLRSVLGAGGMGAVFEAEDERTGTIVALKLLLPELAGEAAYLARFQRETEVMSLLAHPHVVRALDSGLEDDGMPWLVMERAPGESLAQLLRRDETLSVGRAVAIVRQIVAAVGAAHEVGIVHRDLKPANVMIDGAGDALHAKVLDFGIARFVHSPTYQRLTVTGHVVGTPAYMAPEQAFGERVGPAADVYAIGAILQALLTGEPPYGRGPMQEVLPRLMSGDRTSLTRTHRELGPIVDVIERCLSREPEQRYASAEELDAALAPFDQPRTLVRKWTRPPTLQSLVLPPDPELDAPGRRRRRSPRPATAAAMPPVTRQGATPGATATVTTENPTPRRLRMPAMVLAAVIGIAGGAGLVAIAMTALRGSDDRSEAASERLTEPAPTPPILLDASSAEDASDEGAAQASAAPDPSTAPSSDHAVATARAEARTAHAPSTPPEPPAAAAHTYRFVLAETHVAPSRLRPSLTAVARHLDRCLRGGPRWVFDVHVYPDDAMMMHDYGDLPQGPTFDCINVATVANTPPHGPVGDWSLRYRLTVETVPEGEGAVAVVDQTDWSSRAQVSHPRLRVTAEVTEGKSMLPEVRAVISTRVDTFRTCLELLENVSPPPPYSGEFGWTHINGMISRDYHPPDGTPNGIANCLGSLSTIRPIVPASVGHVTVRFRAVAADRTTVEVR